MNLGFRDSECEPSSQILAIEVFSGQDEFQWWYTLMAIMDFG